MGPRASGRGVWSVAGALGTLALMAAALAAPGPATASAPALPTGCGGNSFAFLNTVPRTVSGGVGAPPVVSTVQVSGAQPYIRDVDLIADISHSFSADLDVTLTSPAGTTVTITTDNGDQDTGRTNVFGNGSSGTRWDDDAPTPVTDAVLVNNVPSQALIPEEAMAAFNGENPNGTWTLSVADDAVPDNGSLNSWSLQLATIEGTPTIQTTVSGPGAPTGAIPNPGTLPGTATIAGAGTYLSRLTLLADISHQASGDLGITLTSPGATPTTVSSNNGAAFDNVFGNSGAGTSWHDDAGDTTADPGGGPVTDADFQNNVVETDLVPEGAMGAFIGEDPNGSWSLNVSDLFVSPIVPPPGDGGNVNSWSLSADTISGCTTTPGNTPPIANAGGPYAVTEGGSVTLDASGSSDPDMDPLTYSWDLNGDGTFGDASGQNPTVNWSQLTPIGVKDGPSSHQVTVLVFDGSQSTTSAPTTLTVNNAPPALAISGPDSVITGSAGTWTFKSTDPSPVDQAAAFSAMVDWNGDGTPDQTVSGPASLSIEHVYPAPGTYTISATSTDKDSGQSRQATRTVTVTQPAATTAVCKKRKRKKHGHQASAAKKHKKKCKRKKKRHGARH